MRVCASINYGPHQNGHERFDSVAEAIEYFRREVIESPYLCIEFSDYPYADYGVMDLYPQCDLCTDGSTFHDYPMARYGIGKRGGLHKASI